MTFYINLQTCDRPEVEFCLEQIDINLPLPIEVLDSDPQLQLYRSESIESDKC